jgi:hypothetical protein
LSASAAGFKAAIDHYKFYLKKLPIYAEGGRLLRSIPAETDHWIRAGSDFVEQAETLEVLGTENYVTRYYAQKGVNNGKPKIVQLHVAYYTNMIDTVPHVPERCFTGAGMNLVDGPENIALTLDTSSWLPSPDQRPPGQPRPAVHHAPFQRLLLVRARTPRESPSRPHAGPPNHPPDQQVRGPERDLELRRLLLRGKRLVGIERRGRPGAGL